MGLLNNFLTIVLNSGAMNQTPRHLILFAVTCANAAASVAFLLGAEIVTVVGVYLFGGWLGLLAGAVFLLCRSELESRAQPIPNNLSTFSLDELEQLAVCRLPVRTSQTDMMAEGTFVRLKGGLAEVEWDNGGASFVPLKKLALARRVASC